MKTLVSILFYIVGFCAALYVGDYLCFLGGIFDIIEAIRVEGILDKSKVIWGIIKMASTGLVAWLTGALFFLVGGAIQEI